MHIFALYHLLSKETIGQVFTVVGHQHCLQSVFVQLTSATHALLSCVKCWYDCYTVKHVIKHNIFVFYWSLSYWQSQQQIVRFEHTQSALGRATDRRYQNTEIFGKVPQGRDLERGLFEHERKKIAAKFSENGGWGVKGRSNFSENSSVLVPSPVRLSQNIGFVLGFSKY